MKKWIKYYNTKNWTRRKMGNIPLPHFKKVKLTVVGNRGANEEFKDFMDNYDEIIEKLKADDH